MLASDTACLASHGPTDTGWGQIFSGILTAFAIYAAVKNAETAYKVAKKESQMATRYYNLSKDLLEYYKDNYAKGEDEEVAEALALEKEEPMYDIARGRARAVAWMTSKGIVKKTTKCLSKYCTGLRQEILFDASAAIGESISVADGLGYRNERAYVAARDDVRWDKQMNVIKRGRNMFAAAVSYAKSASGIYGDIGEQAWNGLNSAAFFVGYSFKRNDIMYPNVMLASYDKRNIAPTPQEVAQEGETILRDIF